MKDKKNITIYDIADEAGVSASLVSRVVSGKGSVSDKNRKRIEELIAKYNFRPSAVARGLQKRKSGIIGFVLPHIGNEYFSSTYYEFEKLASENGYMTILCNGKSDPVIESEILDNLYETRVEAVIFMGGRADLMGIEDEYIEELRSLNESIPCIVCSSRAEMFGCIGVHGNDSAGIYKLMEHIAEQGYKTAGILGGTDQSYPSKVKKKAYQDAAKEFGIEIRKQWIIGESFGTEDGIKSMTELLKQNDIPEVACCINDHVAVGALKVAADAGLSIPKDIAITGYDGVEPSILSRPQITTVSLDYSLYGKKIYQAMIAQIEGKEFDKLTLIEPEVIVRESTLR